MKADDHLERILKIIEEIHNRAEKKLERRSTAGPGPNREEALEELRVCVEELRVAGEELRHQNEALSRERQRYADLFNFAPDAYLITDADGVIQEANRAAGTLLNCPQQFLIGKPLVVFVAREDHRAFRLQLTTVRLEAMEKVEDWRITIQPRETSAFRAAMTAGAIQDPVSRLIGLRWLIRPVPG